MWGGYKQSKNLIVVFSGFTGHHEKGRNNYIRTLKGSSYDQLYIRDDFGFERVGSYYLGNYCTLYDQNGIDLLINHFIDKYHYEKVVFAGTSKGGSSALLYGIKNSANEIVIGSPQYFIGNYLMQNDYHKDILSCLIDDKHPFEWLNSLIKNYLMNSDYVGQITMVYSSKEPSWNTDLKELLLDFNERKFSFECLDKRYENHNDVGKHFKVLLKERYCQ